ncbi:NUDIX domain-containing protein [Niveibacterium sp. 24ML]|uniref:NUDIX hydrolase n=1 Tax=Niveibacterium sp. 24ML TaxID=2985512 RepID=UPI00226F1F6D|nr:NUDIX domain-containing protein [Niveibacterium sp. 24ML]MCX9157705.1 NUDIX domain-containing protein [Niveibacterium sp. 24ML]
MRLRRAARILLIDQTGSVLLFRIRHRAGPHAGQYGWMAPGGALMPGEDFEAAARRELLEETGVRAGSLGTHVDERRFTLTLESGETVRAQERFFVLHTARPAISNLGWSEQERQALLEQRWWSAADIATTTGDRFPPNLLTLLTRLTKTDSGA